MGDLLAWLGSVLAATRSAKRAVATSRPDLSGYAAFMADVSKPSCGVTDVSHTHFAAGISEGAKATDFEGVLARATVKVANLQDD